jgi:hypothetical protein
MLQRVIAKLENDVRNEMHSIMGMLELVAEEPVTESQYDRLRACRSSAGRPEAAKPQLSEIDLREVVADTAGLLEELARHEAFSPLDICLNLSTAILKRFTATDV